MTTIYVCLVEVRPREGAAIDPGRVAGAAVRCYVPADDEERAREVLSAALMTQNLDLCELEFCCSYDSPDWERADEGTDAEGVRRAMETGTVAFGTFHTWGHNGSPDAV